MPWCVGSRSCLRVLRIPFLLDHETALSRQTLSTVASSEKPDLISHDQAEIALAGGPSLRLRSLKQSKKYFQVNTLLI